jgi:phosphoribosyl-ATP pyrophosphohydrolase/phosphoribosyl-AMP cyclohydrolase
MKINFNKNNGLIPAIIQDSKTEKVLMLGYMNNESLDKTYSEKKVTFFSRSRQSLWTKGETSGNYLLLDEILLDCDGDTLLIKANPTGPVCHKGEDTCFNEENRFVNFLEKLEEIIYKRKSANPDESYTAKLFNTGILKIAQKVGEESVEVIIEALAGTKANVAEESADLLYHLLVLLSASGLKLSDIVDILEKRHKSKPESKKNQ